MFGIARYPYRVVLAGAFCAAFVNKADAQPTFTVQSTFNFLQEVSSNPVGFGPTSPSFPFYEGGLFDSPGILVSPTCVGGNPMCMSLLNMPSGTHGSMNTNVSGQAFNNLGIQIPINGSLSPVPFHYSNSQALPTEFDTNLPNTTFPGGTIPGGSYWNLTVTNAGVSNSPLTEQTPALTTAALPPPVTSVTVYPGVNPTITWMNPPGAPDTIEIQLYNLTQTNGSAISQQIFEVKGLPGTTITYTLPTTYQGKSFSLNPGDSYSIAVEINQGTTLRSSVYTAPFSPNMGASPVILPILIPTSGGVGFAYQFDTPVTAGQPISIDPQVAVGFIYQIGTGDPKFASVELPDIGNPSPYDLYLWNGSSFEFAQTLAAVTIFDFASAGVSEFEILGIDPNLGLNPLNSTDFVTPLTFVGDGTFTGTMTPITERIAATPEPASLSLLVMSLLGLAVARRRKPAPAPSPKG
jgi:hypothetical protein